MNILPTLLTKHTNEVFIKINKPIVLFSTFPPTTEVALFTQPCFALLSLHTRAYDNVFF